MEKHNKISLLFADKTIYDYALKVSKGNDLHKDIVYRKKTGFGAPLRQWVKSDFKVLFDTYLNKEILEKHGVFNPAQVAQLLKDNYSAKVDADYDDYVVGISTSAVPVPAALPLMASALGAFGLSRRNKKAAK